MIIYTIKSYPRIIFYVYSNNRFHGNILTKRLIKLYKGGGMYGRPPFDPAIILKMEIIAYLYKLSERQVEVYINENIPANFFIGLAADQKAPDHSTLTVFHERLLTRGKLEVFEEMLDEIIQIARDSGVQFGAIQIIDSVHSVANGHTAKDKKRAEKGKPRDPDARWGAKHKRKVKTEDGKELEQTEYFFGYKTHVRLNAQSGLITSLEVTPGDTYDGHHFCSLVSNDLKQKLPVDTYAADKGYDDGENHFDYPGIFHYALQSFFTAMVLNLKRMVKVLTWVGFKTQKVSHA